MTKKVDRSQDPLFEIAAPWDEQWRGMPEFNQEDQTAWQSIKVHFRGPEDRAAFARLVDQPISDRTRMVWYPKATIGRFAGKSYRSSGEVKPRYPIYVPTKGRWESALTIKALERLGLPYFAVIQPQELGQYSSVVKSGEILLLPEGLDGLVPARNWIKDHAMSTKAKRHWQIDDNIGGFYRLNNNLKVPVTDGAIFRAMEDYSDRYLNVAISGPNYFMFASRKDVIPPIVPNTRVYSCSLVDSFIPYYWRGVYNDDTDICLRLLKDGFCTILFNAFLCLKATTMTVKGGNTPIYQEDGRLKMAQSLRDQHPDVVTITEKWGRSQHHVNYKPFRKNRLLLRPETEIPEKDDNFGMGLVIDPSYGERNGKA